MSDIVLATFNARYHHASFGLRYLWANLGDLAQRTQLKEFQISQSVNDALSEILADPPRILGLGVYIWNIDICTRFVVDLKRIAPRIIVVLGGPEVSYEQEELTIVKNADYVIAGEGDLAFRGLCQSLLSGTGIPQEKIIAAKLPTFDELQLPYGLYNEEDLAHRTLYVEASRGCPFTCEFCLSSLEIPVRAVDLDRFLAAMEGLLARGAKQFKFIDRTFNLNLKVSQRILEFFLERYVPGMFLHFEMIPDRLPAGLRETIRKFPPGVLQFEVGIQTFNPEVAALIARRQNNQLVEENLRFLRDFTGVHVHADLIVGLPGETLESFAVGFNRLVALRPQEIQVGMLKRLRGTPIVRHDEEWQMVYSAHAPYEILSNRLLDFATVQMLRRFARYWDLVGNSGNFIETLPCLWQDRSPFAGFLEFSAYLAEAAGRTHGIGLTELAQHVFEFLQKHRSFDPRDIARKLYRDYARGARAAVPAFLRSYLNDEEVRQAKPERSLKLPQRQARHSRV